MLASSPTGNPYSSYHWLRAWWQHFGTGRKLCVLLCRRGDQTVGIAPLVRSQPPDRQRSTLEFLGAPNADYADMIGAITAPVLHAIVQYLQTHRADWDRVVLTQLPQNSATVSAAPEVLRACRCAYRIRPIERASRFVFPGGDDERAAYSIRRNPTLRRNLHFLERLGNLTYRCLTTPSEIRPHLPSLFHCHVARWQDTSTPSKFLDLRHRLFYEDLVSAMGPRGEVFLSTLALDRLPLAYLFGYRHGATAYLYTVASSSYYARRSLGIMICSCTVEHLIRAGCRTVDFGRGGHEYKGLFINEASDNYVLEIFHSPIERELVVLYEDLKTAPIVRAAIRARWVQRLKRLWLQDAAVIGALRVGGRSLKAIAGLVCGIGRLSVMERNTEAPVPDLSEPPIEELPVSGIPELANFLGLSDDAPELRTIREAYERGDACWVTRLGGGVVAAVWVRRGRVSHPALRGSLQLGPGEACLCGAIVSPLVARSLVEKPLLACAVRHYAGSGTRLLALCSASDVSAVANLEQLGFRHLLALRETRLFRQPIRGTHRLP
jgi:CelD/BcsL family acetyltransferase involved in cellulose biosynthesis